MEESKGKNSDLAASESDVRNDRSHEREPSSPEAERGRNPDLGACESDVRTDGRHERVPSSLEARKETVQKKGSVCEFFNLKYRDPPRLPERQASYVKKLTEFFHRKEMANPLRQEMQNVAAHDQQNHNVDAQGQDNLREQRQRAIEKERREAEDSLEEQRVKENCSVNALDNHAEMRYGNTEVQKGEAEKIVEEREAQEIVQKNSSVCKFVYPKYSDAPRLPVRQTSNVKNLIEFFHRKERDGENPLRQENHDQQNQEGGTETYRY